MRAFPYNNTEMEQSKNIETDALFLFLKGTWSFDRTIRGHGSMSGVAAFRNRTPTALDYDESGTHAAKGGAVDFYQSYIYVQEGGDIAVTFKDGRPFHTLTFDNAQNLLTASAVHLCGDDVYRGEYVFHDNDNFSLRWDVKGPRKNYLIETNYVRQGSC